MIEQLRERVRLRAAELFARFGWLQLGFATLAVRALEYLGAPTPERRAALRERAQWALVSSPPGSVTAQFAIEVLEFLAVDGGPTE